MITVNFEGLEITLRDELFDKSPTLRLIQKVRKDYLYIYDVLDRLVVGGAELVEQHLDPVNGEPDIKEIGDFIERLFSALPDLKNSSGSQNSSQSASQPLGQISNDTTESTSILYSETNEV